MTRAVRMRLVTETVRVFDGGKDRAQTDRPFVRGAIVRGAIVCGAIIHGAILVNIEGTVAVCIQINNGYGAEDVIEPNLNGG